MFFALCIGSMLGYALQSALLLHHIRRLDGVSVAFYRAVSFLITMTPLLAFVPAGSIAGITRILPTLVIAGIAGSLHLSLFYAGQSRLGLGVANALQRGIATLTLTGAGTILLRESLHPASIIATCGIIVGIAGLSLSRARSGQHHYDPRGIFFILGSCIPYTITMMLFLSMSRTIDPLLAGVSWEISIGGGALLLASIRRILGGKGIEPIDRRTFVRIAACSAPTVVGTGLLAMALQIGPLSIAASIGAASLAVMALLGMVMYHEHLSIRQWLAIFIVLGGVVILRIAQG